METLPVALVLGSALLHAGWNAVLKKHADPPAATAAVIALCGVFAGLVALAGPRPAEGSFGSQGGRALALLCGLSEAIYFACLARALRDGDLGPGYVVSRGGSILIVWPMAFAVQGECLTPARAAGVLALLAGLVLVYPGPAAPGGRGAYGWAMGSALFVASNHVLYKAALSAGASPWPLFALAMAVAAPLNAAVMAGGLPRVATAFRLAPGGLCLGALQCTASFGLALHALQLAGAAWVGTLRNSSVAMAPLLGWGMLGERPSRRAWAGFALVAASVLLLA